MKNKFSTSDKVFLILKFILKNEIFTLDKILSKLEEENIYIEKETLNKYIRTLIKMGFLFERHNNKTYRITKLPFNLNIEQTDFLFELLNILETAANCNFSKTFQKMALFVLPEKQKEMFSKISRTDKTIQKIEKYIKEAQRLKIIIKCQEEKEVKKIIEPYDVYYKTNGNYIVGYDIEKKEITEFPIKQIVSLKQMPIKNKHSYTKNEAIIKFSQKVAQSYVLKDEEILMEKTPEYIIVKTFFADKESFYKRILRYGDFCEILSGEKIREDFQSYLKDLYQMYDCKM